MQITDILREQMGPDWCRIMSKFIESEDMDNIFRELKSRKSRGILTAPDSSDLWRAFKLCPYNDLKVVIAGISPYHTFTKDNKPVADGIALSCSKIKMLQPSLENLYTAWNNEYSDTIDVDMDKNPDLSYLAEQGVLLYNIGLTVKKDMACSDNILWSKFNQYLWTQLSDLNKGLCIVLLGSEAHKSAQYIDPLKHYIFKLSHPASAAYQNTVWSTEGVFRKIDKILMDNNGIKIDWFRHKNWQEKRTTWEELAGMKLGTTKSSLQKEWESGGEDLPWNQ